MDFVWWIVDKFWGILGWVVGWATRQAKDAARAALEKEVRTITNFVQGYQKTKDADQPAPTNPAALVCLTMTTKPTFRAEFKPGEGGNK